MKKYCIVFNHFQIQDGVARAAIGLANELAKHDDIEVTLRPIFKFDKKIKNRLHEKVRLKPLFRFYFRGFSKIIDLLPDCILYRMIFMEKYDVEIGFCMNLPIKAVGVSKNKTCEHYAWMHGYDEGLTLLPYYKMMDKVICVSKCNADRFKKETEEQVCVDYCYNLIDDEYIRNQGDAFIDMERHDKITFVSVGRLSPEKGYFRLLECIARLKREGYSFNLWLIGDGPLYVDLIEKSKDLNLDDVVFFLGEQENPHAYTAKADVFVCSSLSEGYSTACTEALMLGIPVLTSSVGGSHEIISTAKCGLLVGMEDNDLYDGMKSILDSPEMIMDWKNTLKKTKHCFSYEERVKKIYDIFDLN